MLLAIFISSCSSDYFGNDLTVVEQITKDVNSGSWIITLYSDSGVDETQHFSSYEFTFGSDGVVSASDGTNEYQGTWDISSEMGDDDSIDDVHFNLYFNLMNDFEDLNDDWEILANTASKIELVDISGGDGDTDYLTFEKN